MCYKKTNEDYPVEKLGKLTKHHRRCKSRGGTCTIQNISYVPQKLHEKYHDLFCNFSPTKIAHILNEHWIDPDYTMIAVHKDDLDAVNRAIGS